MVIELDEVAESEIEQEVEELENIKIAEPTYMSEELDDRLYDETGDKFNIYEAPLNNDLEDYEIEEARMLERIGIRGLMLATGIAGSGKGLVCNTVAWKVRRYFRNRRVLMDYRPRKAFDMFAPENNKYFLFNSAFMMNQLRKMADAAGTEITDELSDQKLKGKKLKEVTQSTSSLAEQWTKHNQVLLLGAVMVLDEFKRYFHNRRPHNPYGVLLGHVINIWRHLDLLMIGMAQLMREIDAISCQPHITHHIKCSWNGYHDYAEARVFRTKYVGTRGVMTITGKPIKLIVDGKKPRKQLGGYRFYDLYPTKNLQNLLPSTKGGIKI
jgi:hypothetical protein